MTGMLLQIQREEFRRVREVERREKGREDFATSVTGLLHRRRKKEVKSRFDKFKEVKFSGNHHALREFKDINIYSLIQECSRRGVNRVYDHLYSCYMDGSLPPDEWTAFENLIWNRGEDLIKKPREEID